MQQRYLFILLHVIAFEFLIFSFRLIITHVTIKRLLTAIAPCVIAITKFLEISPFTCIGTLVLEARLDEFFN